jgi:hypothetical protein
MANTYDNSNKSSPCVMQLSQNSGQTYKTIIHLFTPLILVIFLVIDNVGGLNQNFYF